MSESGPPQHFVYLYRDRRGRPRYVGFGKAESRASSHASGSHNAGLREFLKAGNYALEIAGPFASEQTGRAVETALISALRPDFNVASGNSLWQFRPLGVPEAFAERLMERPLLRRDFCGRGNACVRCPVIFVRISNQSFDDGRVGYEVAAPPSDEQIVERVMKWWQLGRFVQAWSARPASGPRLLVGICGRPGAQIVIASMEIDARIDVFGLRGRRLDLDAGVRFGRLRGQQFAVLLRSGAVLGGHELMKSRKWR